MLFTSEASIPVATTLTRIEPSILAVSRVEPTMILASASTSSRIRFAASSSSNKCQIMTTGDVDQNTFGATQADFVQERVGNGFLGCLDCAIFAGILASAHHSLAHLVHHGAHIGKIKVDQDRGEPSGQ